MPCAGHQDRGLILPAQRVLVVGAGMAGLRTAESLRKAGFAGEVLVIGDEPWAPYNRPPLSKEALRYGADHGVLAFRQRSDTAEIAWRLGERVTRADLHARVADLQDGSSVEFDALVAATGVSARRLDVDGPAPQARSGRHVVRTVEDARALHDALLPGARVVVVGAGFIGCEVAVTARLLGCEVTCVAADVHPMLRPLGVELAAELQRRHEQRGITFRLGTGVRAFTGEDRVDGVALTDGTQLGADVVVEAVGSRCNSDWLTGQGLDLSDGVLTDGALRPLLVDAAGGALGQLRHVAVVGDLARFPNRRFSDAAHRVEHWSIPGDTARRAAAVLAAELRGEYEDPMVGAPWDLLPSFWSHQDDVRLQSYGMPGLASPDDIRLLEGRLDADCVMGYFAAGVLVGVIGIGMPTALARYRPQVGGVRSGAVRPAVTAVGRFAAPVAGR